VHIRLLMTKSGPCAVRACTVRRMCSLGVLLAWGGPWLLFLLRQVYDSVQLMTSYQVPLCQQQQQGCIAMPTRSNSVRSLAFQHLPSARAFNFFLQV